MQNSEVITESTFEPINRGYNSVFQPDRLSVGLVVPIEHYPEDPVPDMFDHVERVQLAEELGFSAVWLRDVPFDVKSFGDAGQIYDPFVYLGLLAGKTQSIALGVASIILPLRHPAHVAKAAASIDALSDGRLILGIASGDRPEEYPALNMSFPDRGMRFRASYDYIRHMGKTNSEFSNSLGRSISGVNMLPKPDSGKLPLLVTGGSQQEPEWIAKNGDGWMLYPREAELQSKIIDRWRADTTAAGQTAKPAMEPLYIDLTEKNDRGPRRIHLGYRLSPEQLIEYLRTREDIGVNHVALNLRFNRADIETTLRLLAEEVLPEFSP